MENGSRGEIHRRPPGSAIASLDPYEWVGGGNGETAANQRIAFSTTGPVGINHATWERARGTPFRRLLREASRETGFSRRKLSLFDELGAAHRRRAQRPHVKLATRGRSLALHPTRTAVLVAR